MNHICSDGRSCDYLAQRINTIYHALSVNSDVPKSNSTPYTEFISNEIDYLK